MGETLSSFDTPEVLSIGLLLIKEEMHADKQLAPSVTVSYFTTHINKHRDIETHSQTETYTVY
jgi:hypothetical protein